MFTEFEFLAEFTEGVDRLTVPGVKPMDLVVMCNVLHEIPVRQWLSCFKQIHELLSDDGQLVILEDQLPSVGELPHANGYVILDEVALQELFGDVQAVKVLSTAMNGRLTAYGIQKAFLRNASASTIQRSLEKVKRRAKEQLLMLRNSEKGPRSFQEGRRHAHYALLYANAELAIEEYS